MRGGTRRKEHESWAKAATQLRRKAKLAHHAETVAHAAGWAKVEAKTKNRDELILHEAKFSVGQSDGFTRACDVHRSGLRQAPKIMGSVALQKVVASERIARFMWLFGNECLSFFFKKKLPHLNSIIHENSHTRNSILYSIKVWV